ncbi:MAG: hypothetical protein GVY13_04140 [Alphaproteobacteria bacterium]|jgi:hypothetical protein|nr:hypothetical protein [Alphaproteobacteria bacterium]
MKRAVAIMAALAMGFGTALAGPGPAAAQEWLDRALETGEEVWRDVEEAAGAATQTAEQWADEAGDWFARQYESGSNLTAEQVQQFVADLDTLNRYARDAGYSMERFDVGVGLIPQVRLHYDLERRLPPEELTALVERIEADDLSMLQRYVLSSLLTASEYADQLSVGAYSLRGVWITLAIPPNVRLIFRPEDDVATEPDPAP